MPDLQTSGGCDDATGLMSVGQARDLALAEVQPIAGRETCTLDGAPGRVLVKALHAPVAMPLFDNSAMDGFALRCSDLDGVGSLPIAGTVAAGDNPGPLPPGAALRIYTGAPMPAGADAVVMVERCREADGRVAFDTAPRPGDNIRRAGSDQALGEVLIAAHTRLAPHHVGLLAANGIGQVAVVRRPRVAVFSTGDELRDGAVGPGQIPDANRPTLIALCRQAGAEVTDLGILPDDRDATRTALAGLGDGYDLIVTSGAVSMGGRDHVRDALIDAGGQVNGWRVAVKPGKPVVFGRIGDAVFTGLPGNPFAVYVGFHLFVAAQIARLTGQHPAGFATIPARAGFDWTRSPGRAEVFPVRLDGYGDDGLPVLTRLGRSVSATLLPLGGADGLAMVPADCDRVAAGDRLHWHRF
jgi:molybdopterin molybdotransferase